MSSHEENSACEKRDCPVFPRVGTGGQGSAWCPLHWPQWGYEDDIQHCGAARRGCAKQITPSTSSRVIAVRDWGISLGIFAGEVVGEIGLQARLVMHFGSSCENIGCVLFRFPYFPRGCDGGNIYAVVLLQQQWLLQLEQSLSVYLDPNVQLTRNWVPAVKYYIY